MGNGIIKLIDFGCAKRLKKNQSSNSIKQLLKSLKGTPYVILAFAWLRLNFILLINFFFLFIKVDVA